MTSSTNRLIELILAFQAIEFFLIDILSPFTWQFLSEMVKLNVTICTSKMMSMIKDFSQIEGLFIDNFITREILYAPKCRNCSKFIVGRVINALGVSWHGSQVKINKIF
jgi:hypothetical protein